MPFYSHPPLVSTNRYGHFIYSYIHISIKIRRILLKDPSDFYYGEIKLRFFIYFRMMIYLYLR